MAYKTGTIMYVKTTDEPVLVVGSRPLNPKENVFPTDVYSGSGTVVVVRRPIQTENGITYKFFDFLAEELQTLEEMDQRRLDHIKKAHGQAMGFGLLGEDQTPPVKN